MIKQPDAKYVVLAPAAVTSWVDNKWAGEICEEVVAIVVFLHIIMSFEAFHFQGVSK